MSWQVVTSLIGPTGPTGRTGTTGAPGPLLPNFIAVGNDNGCGNNVVVSSDGLVWTNNNVIQPQFDHEGYSVAWNGLYWVAVGSDTTGNTIWRSDDGLIWDNNGITGQFTFAGYDIAWVYDHGFVDSRFWVAVGDNSTSAAVLTSEDGYTWGAPLSGPTFGVAGYGVASDGVGKIVVVGDDSSISGNSIIYYSAGTWTQTQPNIYVGRISSPISTFIGRAVAYNGTYWITVGEDTSANGYSIFISTDGQTWTNQNISIPAPIATTWIGTSIAWNGSLWIANGTDLLISFDGLVWFNASIVPSLVYNTSGGNGGILWTGEYTIIQGTCMITSSSDGLSYSRLMTGVAGYEFASYGNRAAGKRNLPITKIATTTTELTINTLAGTPPVLVLAGAVPEPDGTSNTMLVVGTHDNNSTFQTGVLFDTTFNLPPNYWFNLTDTLTSWGATFDNTTFTAIGTSDPVAIPHTMIQHLSGNGILGNPTSWEININFFGVLTNQNVVFFQYVLSDNLFNSYPLRTYSATNFANVGIGFPAMSFNVIDTVDLNGLRTNLQGGGAFQFTLTIYCFGQTSLSNSFLTSPPPIVSFSLKPLSYSV